MNKNDDRIVERAAAAADRPQHDNEEEKSDIVRAGIIIMDSGGPITEIDREIIKLARGITGRWNFYEPEPTPPATDADPDVEAIGSRQRDARQKTNRAKARAFDFGAAYSEHVGRGAISLKAGKVLMGGFGGTGNQEGGPAIGAAKAPEGRPDPVHEKREYARWLREHERRSAELRSSAERAWEEYELCAAELRRITRQLNQAKRRQSILRAEAIRRQGRK